MGAFIIAGLVVGAGLSFAVLQLLAAGMSDSTDAGTGGAGATAVGTLVVGAVIAASHFLPHLGW